MMSAERDSYFHRDDLIERFAQVCTVMDSCERECRVGEIVDELLELAAHADRHPAGEEAEQLRLFGQAFSSLVSQGTLQQQTCGELAIALGSKPPRPSFALETHIRQPLIQALITIVCIGARTTRDSGVEGLGALLKLYPHPEKMFPPHDEPPGDDLYFRRVARWRLMALAVAGHAQSLAEFVRSISGSSASDDRPRYLDALYERADMIRTLPAIVRQAKGRLPFDPETLLCNAAAVRIEDDGPDVVAAYGRYQENVFRTIAIIIKRGGNRSAFDVVVAAAVRTIPRTIFGPPGACNAKVRATAAVVRTAMRLIEQGDAPESKEALRPLFANLAAVSEWSNVGIAEACYRALTSLLPVPAHNDLTVPALEALFRHLHNPERLNDFAATHRQLLAIGCYRRILIEIANRKDDIQALLRRPSAAEVIDIFQNKSRSVDEARLPRGIDESVLAGTAAERDWLRKGQELFRRWNDFPASDQLLLTRMLSTQIRGARDVIRLAGNPFLQSVYGDLPSVSVDGDERLARIWSLLSAAPPEAAEAVDADLPVFLEYSGGMRREKGALPGNVLAMVSTEVSGRIADVIGREIDLHLRRERLANPNFDLAAPLYQVMLRGPNEIIFDALLRRVLDPADRQMVALFRKHVATVRGVERDRASINAELLHDINNSSSPTLQLLYVALSLYRDLAADDESVWETIAAGPRGGLGELLEDLDRLAFQTRPNQELLNPRPALAALFKDSTVELRAEIWRYVQFPIERFELRSAALQHAADIVAGMRGSLEKHEGLRDPERSLLIALMARLRELFLSTGRFYCEEPRKLRESRDRDAFWNVFVRDANERQDRRPPPFHDQVQQFERYFVQWTSSEFEIDALTRAIQDRWTPAFRSVYRVMTSPLRVALFILIPFAIAITLHRLALHNAEGFGFLLLSGIAGFGAAVLWFHEPLSRIGRFFRQPVTSRLEPYRTQCLYPRMAGLIAAPMILTVELDHSYSFPLHAPSSVLLVLMVLAFMTTQAVITASVENDESRRSRVDKIVAVAVTHSFAIAVILSLIFARTHVEEMEKPPLHDDLFLGLLPREVEFQIPAIFGHWPPFVFYPMIVLTWTAMGLLIGVVLEGFLKRESAEG